MNLHVPLIENLRQSVDSWGNRSARVWQGYPVPLENYHSQLGIRPGSRVLFIAGARGHWPHQLAQTTHVEYTDVSQRVTAKAKNEFDGKGIQSFSVSDALDLPSKPCDYVVSFQPYPIVDRLPFVILRSMVHARGVRLIDSVSLPLSWIRHYAPKAKTQAVDIAVERGRKKAQMSFDVLWADSTTRGKKRAQLDLNVLSALQSRESVSIEDLQRALVSEYGLISRYTLRKSLLRLAQIGEFFKVVAPAQNALRSVRSHRQ